MTDYYFDAKALIKYSALQDYKSRSGISEKGIDQIQQLISQADNRIYYSSLTLLECWRVLLLSYRKNILGKSRSKHANKALQFIVEKLIADLQSPPFVKLDTEMSEDIVMQAHRLIEHHGTSKNVGSVDMLHIALIKRSAIEMLIMVSSDKVVKNVCIAESIHLFDPENQLHNVQTDNENDSSG